MKENTSQRLIIIVDNILIKKNDDIAALNITSVKTNMGPEEKECRLYLEIRFNILENCSHNSVNKSV